MFRLDSRPTCKMRLAHLAGLARRLRAAQRRFFETREQKDLLAAMKLETEFDKLLREEEQPDLFDADDE